MTTKYVQGNRLSNDPENFACKFNTIEVNHWIEPRGSASNVGRIKNTRTNIQDKYVTASTLNPVTPSPSAHFPYMPFAVEINYLKARGPNGELVSLELTNHPIYQIWRNEYYDLPVQAFIPQNQGKSLVNARGYDAKEIPLTNQEYFYNPVMRLASHKVYNNNQLGFFGSSLAGLETIDLKGVGVFANQVLKIRAPEFVFLPMINTSKDINLFAYPNDPNPLPWGYSSYVINRTVRGVGGIDSFASIYQPRPERPCVQTLDNKMKIKPALLWEPIVDTQAGPIRNGMLYVSVIEITENYSSVLESFAVHTRDIAEPWPSPQYPAPGIGGGLYFNATNFISSTCKVYRPSAPLTTSDDKNSNYIQLGPDSLYKIFLNIAYVPDSTPRNSQSSYQAEYTIELKPTVAAQSSASPVIGSLPT